MLSLSPRYDLFRFLLPKEFLPKEVEEKWKSFITKEPGIVVTPIDYLNESIKGINLPGISDVNITQNQHSSNSIERTGPDGHRLGRLNVEPNQNNTYISPANPLDKMERKFTVQFRLNQGLYNYFMLYETLFHRICKPLDYRDGDNFNIQILNEMGNVVMNVRLLQCYMDGMEGLEFGYDKVERQSDSFSVTWAFNNLDIDFNVPGDSENQIF